MGKRYRILQIHLPTPLRIRMKAAQRLTRRTASELVAESLLLHPAMQAARRAESELKNETDEGDDDGEV